MTAATFPYPFVPIAELPGVDLDPGPLGTPEFVMCMREIEAW